jgi:death-on-curing protein
MREPVWIDTAVFLALHDEQLVEHGGQSGLRDAGLLDSALARPRNRYAYETTDLPTLAASYTFGLVRNHPFIDGNKRTGLVVAELFLNLNEVELTASDAECVMAFLQLAAGEMTEMSLAGWIAEHSAGK